MKKLLFSTLLFTLSLMPLLSLAQNNEPLPGTSQNMMEGGEMMDGNTMDGMGDMTGMMNMMSMMDECPMMANSTVWQVFGLLFGILLLILMVLGIVVLIKQLNSYRGGGSARALSILRERYARGEIDKEEFESSKDRLTS